MGGWGVLLLEVPCALPKRWLSKIIIGMCHGGLFSFNACHGHKTFSMLKRYTPLMKSDVALKLG